MKKYLLLIEDEELWEKFKKCIDKDINSEIISLIEKHIENFEKLQIQNSQRRTLRRFPSEIGDYSKSSIKKEVKNDKR